MKVKRKEHIRKGILISRSKWEKLLQKMKDEPEMYSQSKEDLCNGFIRDLNLIEKLLDESLRS